MIDEPEARTRVRAHLESDEFELHEFSEGWLVEEKRPEVLMGASTFAVERATGDVWEFPSAVPPRRVMLSFEEVKARGWKLEPRP